MSLYVKALQVINSCTSSKQIPAAKRFARLAYKRMNQPCGIHLFIYADSRQQVLRLKEKHHE